MDPLMLLLRVLHIVAGLFWTGATVTLAFILFPAVRDTAPAGAQVMRHVMNVRRLPVWLNAAGGLTLVSGLGMMWHNGALSAGAWFGTSTAHTLMLGASLAVLGGIIGSTANRRTAMRIAALGAQLQAAGGPPSPAQAAEMGALQRRMMVLMHAVAGLLVLAAAMMAVARYV